MKNRPSIFRKVLAAFAATAVCVCIPSNIVSAQNTSAPNANMPGPTTANATQSPVLPMGASEVVKMYQGGIKKDVIISYINNTSLPYHMGADGVAYLHSLGVPQDIIQAMIQRDARLQKIQAMQQSTPPSAAPNGVQATAQSGRIVAPSTPPPNIAVIPGGDYGYPYYYDYEYPYYDYGVYGPPIIIGGWGWGGGRGHGGFHGGFGGVHGGGGFHGGGGHGGGGHR